LVTMVTVATKIETPVKLLVVETAPPLKGWYAFAMLELGDILALVVYVNICSGSSTWSSGRQARKR